MAGITDVEFIFSNELIPYPEAFDFMNKRSAAIAEGLAKEAIWFLEHPLTFTAGISSSASEIKDTSITVFQTNRGGKHTLHSPGQRVVYTLLNLKRRSNGNIPDVRIYVQTLEEIIINTLSAIKITSKRKAGHIGVWVDNPKTLSEEKIAAIGVRFSKGVTMHGFALNVCNNLSHFTQIIPCGISGYNICSIKSLGRNVTLSQIDNILLAEIKKAFQL